jgi:deazaflavin-dependent oxidoreductase (nitroreductase family)
VNPIFRLFVKAHVWLYRSSGGKRGATVNGMPVLLLTTHGRKSGKPRVVPVVPFIEGDETYVIASMGGQPQHPAWFKNLEANPEVDVQIGVERWHARAQVLSKEDRAQIWSRITAKYPNFAEYQQKTTRVIPVVRLARAARG